MKDTELIMAKSLHVVSFGAILILKKSFRVIMNGDILHTVNM